MSNNPSVPSTDAKTFLNGNGNCFLLGYIPFSENGNAFEFENGKRFPIPFLFFHFYPIF